MEPDLVVRGRFLVRGAPDPVRAQLECAGGRVLRLVRDARAPSGARIVDVEDALVTPGAVDAHVHFRDPGHPEKEDFSTGTASAAFGGVTAVLDMPNTSPPTTTPATLAEKAARAGEKAHIDFGLYAGLAGEASLALVAEATAVKAYVGASTGDLLVRDWGLVGRAVAEAARAGKVVAVHSEDQGCMEAHAIPGAAPDDWASHARSRPNACEAAAIEKLAGAARAPGARVHVAHLSTAEGLLAARAARFTSEVTPHHLYFVESDLAARGGTLKMNPPLRGEKDREALWDALASGAIDCLASDHAPHTREEKSRDVRSCPAGVPGVETLVPLLMAEVAQDRFPLARLVDAACERPARIFGLPKGRFEPGFDADFAVWDLEEVEAVDASRLHSKCGWTPFEGFPAVFPSEVWMRGEPVVSEGRLVGARGRGRFLDGRFRAG